MSAATASAHDEAAIAAGIPSRALMQRAGAAAAAVIADHCADRLADGVLVLTGSGNNGGDGWVVAQALHAVGVAVQVLECAPARTPDAMSERDSAVAAGIPVTTDADVLRRTRAGIAVDAVLGTGFRADEPIRLPIATSLALLAAARERGMHVVALDLPSGLDADDGRHAGCCPADLTITFGTIKRGQLASRALCGRIVVVDIGLGVHGLRHDSARLATDTWFRDSLPAIAADAHKGTRGKVAIIGGGAGMGGATVLAARGALRSGAGMVKCIVAGESLATVQQAEPAALTAEWPVDDAAMRTALAWADVVLVGPGLGADGARAMVERVLRAFSGPVVLDADALNAFSGDAGALRPLIGDRAALLTPHPLEFARLAGVTVQAVLDDRFTLPMKLASRTGAAVLLKGTPTVVCGASGDVRVVAEGTPVLGTGGSGDVLGGMAAALLAQTADAALAGALAAFAHGRSARLVSLRQVRGYVLDDVLAAMPEVWSLVPPAPRPPILADLPAVGEGAP